MRVIPIDPDEARAVLVAEGLADVRSLAVRPAAAFEEVEGELAAHALAARVYRPDGPTC